MGVQHASVSTRQTAAGRPARCPVFSGSSYFKSRESVPEPPSPGPLFPVPLSGSKCTRRTHDSAYSYGKHPERNKCIYFPSGSPTIPLQSQLCRPSLPGQLHCIRVRTCIPYFSPLPRFFFSPRPHAFPIVLVVPVLVFFVIFFRIPTWNVMTQHHHRTTTPSRCNGPRTGEEFRKNTIYATYNVDIILPVPTDG